jgi:hypothetical protein
MEKGRRIADSFEMVMATQHVGSGHRGTRDTTDLDLKYPPRANSVVPIDVDQNAQLRGELAFSFRSRGHDAHFGYGFKLFAGLRGLRGSDKPPISTCPNSPERSSIEGSDQQSLASN